MKQYKKPAAEWKWDTYTGIPDFYEEKYFEVKRMKEEPEQILCIIDNTNRCKIVAVWSQCEDKIEEVMKKTGFPKELCKREVELLRNNNIIGDKGWINQYAIQFIRALAIKALKKGV